MKKILVLFFVLAANVCFAANATNWDSPGALKRINTIGSKILRANGIYSTVDFKVFNRRISICSDINKEIYIRKELLKNTNSSDEIAAVIAHEVGVVLSGHCSSKVDNIKALNNISYETELDADYIAADLLYNSGYNPLAAISLLNKISGNYNDFLNVNPSGKERLINIYNYIDYNYKDKTKAGYDTESFQKAMLLIQPAVDKRETSNSAVKKYVKNQKKILSNKEKRKKKMKSTAGTWSGYYNTTTVRKK